MKFTHRLPTVIRERINHLSPSTLTTLVDQALVSGTNFSTGVIIARMSGMNVYGKFTLAWLGVQFLASFQTAFLTTPMYTLSYTVENTKGYYRALFFWQTLFAGISFFLILLASNLGPKLFPSTDLQMDNAWFELAIAGFGFWMQDFVRRYFFINSKPKSALINDLLSCLPQVALFIFFASKSLLTVENAFLIMGTTSLFAAVASIVQIRPEFRWASWKESKKYFSLHWNFSRWLLVSALLQWTSANFFMTSTGAILGATASGLLRGAQSIVGVLHVMFQGFENIIPIQAAKEFSTGGPKHLYSYLKKSTLMVLMITSAFCGTVIIFPEFFLNLFYGQKMAGEGYILRWYGISYIIMSSSLTFKAGFRAISHTLPILLSFVAMSLFAIVFASPLIKMFGLNGALWGMVISQIIGLAALIFPLKSFFQNR